MDKSGLCKIWKTNAGGFEVLYKDNNVRTCHAKRRLLQVFCISLLFLIKGHCLLMMRGRGVRIQSSQR